MSPAAERGRAGDGGQNKQYPAPLATHEEVVRDPTVFWDTLRRFHFFMGSKFMIPVIGGKELDLHLLYVEVTRRGGYETVVTEKKWREAGYVFQFAPTTTSASFVLRKHYLSLLYHYEQVHYFRVQGPLSTPNGTSDLAIVEYSCNPMGGFCDPQIKGHPSFSAVGTIEGKFDCGYLVSVQLGSEVLRGVLYHPDQPSSSASAPQLTGALVPSTRRGRPRRFGKRRRRSRRAWDPSYPKPNRSGYNFFFAEKHYKLKSLYPNREREFTKIIGQSWTNLDAEERKVYQNIGLRDKERYKRELKEYYERLKTRQAEQSRPSDYVINQDCEDRTNNSP